MGKFLHSIIRFVDKTLGIKKKDDTLRVIRTINDNTFEKGIKTLERANDKLEKTLQKDADIKLKGGEK